MKETKKYALRATELLTEAEQYEIKAGEKVPITGGECSICAINCAVCSACTACTTCKICLQTMMDVIIVP